jgi:methylglyoxal synthase
MASNARHTGAVWRTPTDVKALLRMAVVWSIPNARKRSSVDFMISSSLMDEEYDRLLPDYDIYRTRALGRGDH